MAKRRDIKAKCALTGTVIWTDTSRDTDFMKSIVIKWLAEGLIMTVGFLAMNAGILTKWDGMNVTNVMSTIASGINGLITRRYNTISIKYSRNVVVEACLPDRQGYSVALSGGAFYSIHSPAPCLIKTGSSLVQSMMVDGIVPPIPPSITMSASFLKFSYMISGTV